jgi:hypothetical protein
VPDSDVDSGVRPRNAYPLPPADNVHASGQGEAILGRWTFWTPQLRRKSRSNGTGLGGTPHLALPRLFEHSLETN